MIREGLLTVLFGVLLAGMFTAITFQATADYGGDAAAAAIERTVLIDRLIGMRVDWDEPADTSELVPRMRETDHFKLLWVIDLQRCAACLQSLAEWNSVASEPEIDAMVVVVGSEGKEGHYQLLRGLRDTRVSYVEGDKVRAVLGPILPSTQVLMTFDGVVLMADGRRYPTQCQWGFPSQVAAVMRLASPGLIRPPPTSGGM